ncbi:MAG: sialidase, partial [Sediminibacterium sp.]|nr:sialidase [Sediminibacterium sp.]
MPKKLLCIIFMVISYFGNSQVVESSQFIYDTASFASSHASTIVETPKGILAAWFGGKFEGDKEVNIYASWLVNNKWSAPFIIA